MSRTTERTRWSDLPGPARIGLLAVGSLDAALRLWSLKDLARRPADEVRGSKRLWALALMTVNSLGLVPLIYLRRARRG